MLLAAPRPGMDYCGTYLVLPLPPPHRHAPAHPARGGPGRRSGRAFVCRRRNPRRRRRRSQHPGCRARHRFQHQTRRYRSLQPGAGDRPPAAGTDRQGHRGRCAALDLGQHRQRQQRDHQQRLGLGLGWHRPARSFAEEHAGAAQRPPPGQLRLPGRRPVGHLRRSQRAAAGGRRTHRSAQGRCIGGVRQRCGGRRGQHHHPAELRRRRDRRQLRWRRPGRPARAEPEVRRWPGRHRQGRLQHPLQPAGLQPRATGPGRAQPDQERHLQRPARRPLERLVGQGCTLSGQWHLRADARCQRQLPHRHHPRGQRADRRPGR